jgi:hypothetical protein
MAKLENNNENENKKSVAENLGNQVQKTVENVQETVKEASELASDAINHPLETAQEFGKQAVKDVPATPGGQTSSYFFWFVLALLCLLLLH